MKSLAETWAWPDILISMMNTLLIVFCAFGFAGIASKAGMLETLLKAITDRVALKRGPLILSTVLSCIMIGFTSGASYLCLIIPAEMFGAAYRKAGLHQVNLSRTIEDAGTVLVPIIPWSMAGIYMSSQLGVSVVEYAPYAFLCYGCFILAIFYGFTGIAIRPLVNNESEAIKNASNSDSAAELTPAATNLQRG